MDGLKDAQVKIRVPAEGFDDLIYKLWIVASLRCFPYCLDELSARQGTVVVGVDHPEKSLGRGRAITTTATITRLHGCCPKMPLLIPPPVLVRPAN